MKYGINTKLVEEVIQISSSMQSINNTNLPENVMIINQYEEAIRLAYDEVYGEDEYTWADIRQLEMGKVRGKLYKLDPLQKPGNLDELTPVISNGLRQTIPEDYSDFFENITVDLRNCAINRAINGDGENFYEQIFKIYKSGGFPCGWDGEYPEEGKIIAFFA